MNYEQALEYIHGRPRPGSRDGLKRISALMEKMGNPHKKLKYVHIAGSNGKGSTAAMCESILRRAGFKTGLFMSPFVFDFRERMQINGGFASEERICQALEDIMPHLTQMSGQGMECTEFDVVTAMAIRLFADEKCDIVVLEVGIGGLLDRTNIIDAPEVAAICSISLEHTQILGGTIPEIAAHKAGIIKPGCRVAAYCDMVPEAGKVILETCARFGIAPNFGDMGSLEILSSGLGGSRIVYKGEEYAIPLMGLHQGYNAVTAISAMEELRLAGWKIPQSALVEGLAGVEVVGRLQTVRNQPLCIIDGAHNPEKVRSLCAAVDSLFPGRPLIAVMGMMSNKDYEKCIPQIASRASVFFAASSDMESRALPAAEVAKIASRFCGDVRVCESPFEAGRLAAIEAGESGLALACGSIYIIGDAKRGFLAAK